MRSLPYLLVLCSLVHLANAQEDKAIVVLPQSHEDGMWLRWSPTNPAVWQLGNLYGYTIERITFQPDGQIEANSKTMLTPVAIKHASEEAFKKIAETSEEAGVVETLLFDKEFKGAAATDDLGAIMKKNKDLQNRFGIAMLMCDLSLDAAKAAGFFYVDKTAVKGKRYAYRIALASSEAAVSPAVSMATFTDPIPLLTINDLTIEFADKKATLSWPTRMHKGIYTAYYVEKSMNGKAYEKISDLPYVHMSEDANSTEVHFVDSLVANQTKVYYRINGITPFAEKGPYSNVVSGEGKDNLAGLLIIREGAVQDKRDVKLTWEFPMTFEKQIAGFFVTSASNPDGPYVDGTKKMLAKNVREYVQPTPFSNTYFVVRAVDKNKKELARSFPYLVQIADEIPPAIPVGLSGSIDANGVAMLTWQPNQENDMAGYRVFRTNSLKEEFVEVTNGPIPDLKFMDSVNIKVLNKDIFYSIIAVDKNYNTSDYSPALRLKRPDIIPPASPVITKTDIVRDTIVVGWINSISDDIAKSELIRTDIAARESRPLLTWRSESLQTVYKDVLLTPGKTYQYTVITYDSAGNSSKSQTQKIYFEPGYRDAVAEMRGTADREKKMITISWKNPQVSTKCIVFRKINEEPFKIIDTVEGNIEAFTDKRINVNNVYTYKVQPVFQSGVRSLLSKELKIVY